MVSPAGPTAAINASLAGVYQAALDAGFGVYGMRYGIEGLLQGKYVDLSEHIKNDLDKELLLRTPSSYLGSCRYKLPEAEAGNEIYEQIFALLEKLNIFAFFYIGGNDSMDTIKKLSDYAALCGSKILFVGVPKTIDNDLACTDHTPGFGSAAKYIAATTREVIRDGLVYDIPSVTILEIMGRNAGWLTAAASLAKGADCEGVDMLFLPEIPFDLDSFSGQVKALMQNRKSLVIAVSEGIRLKDGRFVCELIFGFQRSRRFRSQNDAGCGKISGGFSPCKPWHQDPCHRIKYSPALCRTFFLPDRYYRELQRWNRCGESGSGGKERYCHYAGAYLHRSISLYNLLSGCTQNCECGEKGTRRVD